MPAGRPHNQAGPIICVDCGGDTAFLLAEMFVARMPGLLKCGRL